MSQKQAVMFRVGCLQVLPFERYQGGWKLYIENEHQDLEHYWLSKVDFFAVKLHVGILAEYVKYPSEKLEERRNTTVYEGEFSVIQNSASIDIQHNGIFWNIYRENVHELKSMLDHMLKMDLTDYQEASSDLTAVDDMPF